MDKTYEMQENAKYSRLYSTNYGNGPIAIVVSRLREMGHADFGSIIDLGCGRGILASMLKGYITYHGIDIASSLLGVWKNMPNATFENGSILTINGEYQTAFSIDVLEHLPTDLVESAIQNMVKISKSQVINVSTVPSKHLDENGGNLHLTVRDGIWWQDIISKYTTIHSVNIYTSSALFICGDKLKTEKLLPLNVFGQKVRMATDGTFTLPRLSPNIIKYLDDTYTRVGNANRWTLAWGDINTDRRIDVLFNKAPDDYCYIVGKGPSLDKVTESDFKDHPSAAIFCCNDSVKKIESLDLPNPLYALQQDSELGNKCYTQRGTLIVHNRASHHYKDMPNKIRFLPQQLGTVLNLTVVLALQLAHKMGSTKVVMIAFDSMVNQSTDYAKCIGYSPTRGGEPRRFLNHKSRAQPWLAKFEKVIWLSHI